MTPVMTDYAYLSAPDPEFVAAVPGLMTPRGSESDELDIPGMRERYYSTLLPMILKRREPYLPPNDAYTVTDHYITADDGTKILARCITPRSKNTSTFPLMISMHGGGFFFGDVGMNDYYLRTVSVDLQISIVNIDYRLAPEHPFPTGLNDCYSVVKYIVENPSKFSASLSSGFIIQGSSSGANFATVIAHRALNDPFFKNRPYFTGQSLSMPWVIHPDAYSDELKPFLLSLEQNKDAPLLSKNDLVVSAKMYAAPPDDPEMSPLLYVSHEGLPKTYFQICGWDPLRDEGLLYARKLKESGVSTKVDIYAGLPHGFSGVAAELNVSKKYEQDYQDGIRWLLHRES
ncbi:hypothetical protein GYMLUDRAFT_49960 [Collybiopsis luxurians FD-317 M1]|uniref:Alpha/beta hydrolase fold-3 domain-containing protein n=1 Tax=Collybiopsis luxurians FD-317 M1 TaxID=944289 RepID=A0A0D0C3D9_9AGAR|nr:hypothetical protein GYMLUDRAFT_49960 [Collybiopsis luxurians FD-317 M1]